VLEAGWSDEAYGQWLQRAVRELILADRGTG
jgi:hypothetical protein